MPSTTQAKTLVNRQRKPHRKSRLGCGNCKLRSVKCDETKPACSRCLSSGFACNYSRATPSLQLAHTGAFKLNLSAPALLTLPAPAPHLRIPVAVPVPGRIGDYELADADFATLDRFRKRSSLTVGNRSTRRLFRDGAFDLGSSNPYLLHVFLAFALIHDVCLNPANSTPRHRSSLAFHWYHGTALFKQQLLRPNLSGPERDALWACAALLGTSSFAYTGSPDPEDAWPLKAPDPTDLDWLKMSDGKKVVWKIADPTRPESLFHPLVENLQANDPPDGCAPILPSDLPYGFYDLLGLRGCSATDNPYHVAASIIAQLLPRSIDADNTNIFFTFISQMDPRYRKLVEQKDPRAILLLAWWYAKIALCPVWWLRKRAMMEGQAICLYLAKHYEDDLMIISLLEYPAMALRARVRQGDAIVSQVLGASVAIQASIGIVAGMAG